MDSLFLPGVMFLGVGLALFARPEWLEARYRRHFSTLIEEVPEDDDARALRQQFLLVAVSGEVMILLGLIG